MSDVLAELLAVLDTTVLEETGDGRFVLLTAAGSGIEHLLGVVEGSGTVALVGRSDFLDNFLVDAAGVWSGASPAMLRSGEWLEDGPDGKVPLEATALRHGDRRFLLVEALGASYEERVLTLQIARENRLAQEWLDAEVKRRTSQIRAREEEIAVRLTMATGVRDHETGAHIRRIGRLAELLATDLGWGADDIDDIRVAATMHDIGKIGIPDDILLKPARLSPGERMIMQRHTEFGARILESQEIPLLRVAQGIALSHHEAWDGSGYPRGLREAEIPEAARIVTVVDVFDAMTHARPYKPALSEEETIRFLDEGRGTLFDPELVGIFLDQMPEVRRIQQSLPDGAPEIDLPLVPL